MGTIRARVIRPGSPGQRPLPCFLRPVMENDYAAAMGAAHTGLALRDVVVVKVTP